MTSKRRYMHGKRRRRSPVKKDIDFSKTKDYSPEATKGKLGDKLASALSATSFGDFAPIGKIGKAAKVAYKYFKG